MQFVSRHPRKLVAVLAAALLAGCASKPAVVVAPPPPPIPARPLPPVGAVATMYIPPVNAVGVRQTVNVYLSPAQTVWNLRSALNVAGLTCRDAKHEPILAAYQALLTNHAKVLAKSDRTVEDEFKARYGAAFRPIRDAYATQVHNYFALPPTIPGFCDAALAVAADSQLVAPADLETFAAQALPRLDRPFEAFFRSFDQFRAAAAAWDARYGLQAGPTSAVLTRPAGPRAPLIPQLLQPGAPLAPAGSAPILASPIPAPAAPSPLVAASPVPASPSAVAAPAQAQPPPFAAPPPAPTPPPAPAPAPAPTATPAPAATYGPAREGDGR